MVQVTIPAHCPVGTSSLIETHASDGQETARRNGDIDRKPLEGYLLIQTMLFAIKRKPLWGKAYIGR